MKMNFKILPSSATFHGVVYSDKKQQKGTAKLIYFENFGHLQDGRESISKKEFEDYLTKYSQRNKKTWKPQFHAVMTCKGKEFTDEELKENAIKVMKELGYKDVPILMYSHNDTLNGHIHIVTSRIGQDGKKIPHDMEGVRANKILSKLLNNNPAENWKNDIENALSYNFSTATQFYLLLEKQEYDIKEMDDKIHFFKHGEKQGELEKNVLIEKIESNKLLSRNPAQLKALLYKYSATYSTALKKIDNIHYTSAKTEYGSDLTNYLKETFGYDFVFFTGKNGIDKPFGYSIIDHKNKIFYKGSEVIKLDELLGISSKKDIISNRKENTAALPNQNEHRAATNREENAAQLEANENGLSIGKLVDIVELLLEGDIKIQSSVGESPKRKKKRKNNFF